MSKRNPFEKHWDGVRSKRVKQTNAGNVTVTEHGTRLHIVAPFSPGLGEQWRVLGGKWRPRSRCWSLPADKASAVAILLTQTYGDAVPKEWRP